MTGSRSGSPSRTRRETRHALEAAPPASRRGQANPDAMRLMNLLMTLKTNQLRLMDANFTLEHIVGAKSDSAWLLTWTM